LINLQNTFLGLHDLDGVPLDEEAYFEDKGIEERVLFWLE
jgi:hypothetical protein